MAGGQIPAVRHIYPDANILVNSYIPPNSPTRTNDQDFTTGWITGSAPAWLRVDLGAAKNIDYVTVRWLRNTLNPIDYTFNIETSTNDTTWTSRFSGTHHVLAVDEGPNTTNVVPLTPHSARYVRVNITATTNPIHEVGMGEFEVWGVPDVSATIEPAAPETASRFIYPSENVTASGSTGGNIPANTNDQSITTGWLTNRAPAWLAVNLGVTKYIHYINVRWI